MSLDCDRTERLVHWLWRLRPSCRREREECEETEERFPENRREKIMKIMEIVHMNQLFQTEET